MVCLPACERRGEAPPSPIAAEESPPIEWTTTSLRGHATVTSRRDGSTCRVACEREHTLVWTRSQCLAKAVDHRFVSDDCSAFVALMDAPFVAQAGLSRTPVGTIVRATGEPVMMRLDALTDLKSVKVSQSGRWVAWLQGTVELSGEKPRALADGTGIAFETLDGKTHALSFVELVQWGDPPPGLYQWVDTDGSTRITPFEQISPKARAKAKLITADVSMIKGAPRPAPWMPPAQPDAFPQCATFAGKVSVLEKSLAALPEPALEPCAGLLGSGSTTMTSAGQMVHVSTGNQIGYANCLRSNEEAIKAREQRVASLTAELEVARDELRHIQLAGCAGAD